MKLSVYFNSEKRRNVRLIVIKERSQASTFSQFNVVDSPLSAVRESPIVEAVFIQDIVDEFVVRRGGAASAD